ncbi:MAG: TIGR03088 family PEP-CTERM/XrtA system glycosyltransferase [Gammaproteobacteria bacterium]
MSDSRPLIAHVIHRFAMGGMENGIVNLINGMDRDFAHAIICLDQSTEFSQRLTRDDVQIFSLRKKPGKDLPHYQRLWRVLRELRPSVVHTRNIGTIEAGLVARLAGTATVFHGEHGFDVNDLHGAHQRYRRLRRVANPFIRRFICVSQQIRQWLQRDIGLPEDKLTQIYNGVDTTRFDPARRETARALLRSAGADGEFVVGGVGRLEAVKNPLELVRAFTSRCQTHTDFAQRASLVLLGDGALRDEVARCADESGFAQRVHLLGARDDVAQLMPGFDVFALPSLNEGISNTILEAMASGVPVVASRVGGNAELYRDGQHGTLYESGDVDALAGALGHYADNEPMREERAAAARRHVVQQFSLDRMIDQYQSLYAAHC